MKQETFDLVIVGGGITGAGIARDAASRGMSVAQVEAGDFAGGTSSRSSKLIHGGVRYLENLEFHLVFEALAERALLFRIAPHLVHPLRFLIPIYEDSRVSYWKMWLGMWLYDLLALFETPQMHESLNGTEAKERIADLEGRKLVGAMEYSDAYTDDDRLVIETLRDAHRMGAAITNYTEVLSASQSESSMNSLEVKDLLTGEKFQLRGRQFVSGVGPWTDLFGKALDPKWSEQLRPTKGVHLVFSRKRIKIDRAVVMAVEKRIIFVIPRHEMVIVGTTDTDFRENPREVNTKAEDVAYLLSALNKYFPSLAIEESDIISSYAGVRPLVNDGSESEGKTSREHKIWSHGPNLTFVAGGKYTTYRRISEDAVDHVLKKMDFEKRMAFGPSDTKKPLNPLVSQAFYERAKQNSESLAIEHQINLELVSTLVERHGEEAIELLLLIKQKYHSYSLNEAMWMAEADFAINNTMCMSLEDFYWRRSPLFLAMRDHGIKYVKVIAKVFSEHFQWTTDQARRQEERLLERMRKELSWRSELELATS